MVKVLVPVPTYNMFYNARRLSSAIISEQYTPFAVRNEAEPILRYPSIRVRLSGYIYAHSGHLKIKLFPKRQKNFREL